MQPCPARERLEQFLAGKLAEAEEADICSHVAECSLCQTTLDALVRSKPFAGGRALLPAQVAGLTGSDPSMVLPRDQAHPALNEGNAAGPKAPDPGVTDRTAPPPQSAATVRPGLDFLAPATRPDALGRLGHYEILAEVGRGGMGLVLKAFDEKLHRVVAVKVMAAQLAASATARQRFLREARAAAAVRHEAVIDIYAVDEEPLPYLVMEYIDGKTLQQKLDQAGPLPVKEVLRIGYQIACGLAAAHKQGLIHRDVKPANILLENGVERVKLTDFGLARAADDASLTQSGVLAGTPLYMSPEQAEGGRVDHRSDLFSLGTVLYVMCAGRPPFRASTSLAVLKRVCEDTPRPLAAVNPDVPGWLAAVVARLHAKKPAERYQSAREVAEVLARNLAELEVRGEVSAEACRPAAAATGGPRPASVPWSNRSRRLLLAAAAGLVVTAGVTTGLLLWHHPGGTADQGAGRTNTEPGAPNSSLPGNPLDRRRRADIALPLLALAGGGDPAEAPPELAAVLGDSRFVHGVEEVACLAYSPDGQWLATCANGYRDGQFARSEAHIWEAAGGKLVRTLGGPGEVMRGVAFSPDGKRLATGGDDGSAKVWDRDSGKELFTLQGHGGVVRGVAFSPDGKHIATCGIDGKAILWDAADGDKQLTFTNHTSAVLHLTFSPDSTRVASCGTMGDGTVRVWETATGAELVCFHANHAMVRGAAFSPDGKRVVSVNDSPIAQVWDAATGTPLFELKGHTDRVLAVAWSKDGKHIATGSGDQTVKMWDGDSGMELHSCPGHTLYVASVTFRPDGKQLASGDRSGRVRFWDVVTGEELLPRQGHIGPVQAVAISPDGQTLATGGADHTVRLWDLASWKEGEAQPPARVLRRHADEIWSLAFSPDGKTLASGSFDTTIVLWDVASGQELSTLTGHARAPSHLAFSPDGQTVAAGSEDGKVKLWDVATAKAKDPLHWHGNAWVRAVAFSADGKWLASAAYDRTVQVCDPVTGRRHFTLTEPASGFISVAISPDGKWLAAGSTKPTETLWVWDLETKKGLAMKGAGPLNGLAIQPRGTVIATGSSNGVLQFWQPTAPGSPTRAIGPGPFGEVLYGVAFTPDGRYLATANHNSTVFILKLAEPGDGF